MMNNENKLTYTETEKDLIEAIEAIDRANKDLLFQKFFELVHFVCKDRFDEAEYYEYDNGKYGIEFWYSDENNNHRRTKVTDIPTDCSNAEFLKALCVVYFQYFHEVKYDLSN